MAGGLWRARYLLGLMGMTLGLAGCAALQAPAPTPIVLVVTPPPSATPGPSATPTRTPTATVPPTAVPTATATPLPCATDGVTRLDFNDINSRVSGERLRWRVLLPPCYAELQRRYPLLTLLHAAGATEAQWDALGLEAALEAGYADGTLAPMIVLLPYTGTIGAQNRFPPDASFERVLLDELLPRTTRDFCVWTARPAQALGGISRGGFWAFSIGLRHPDRFGVLGGHSAALDIAVPAAFSPNELARTVAFAEGRAPRLSLDNGAEDPAGTALQTFSNQLTSRAVRHSYLIHTNGGHNDAYWRQHITDYLRFYGAAWPTDARDLPDCALPSPSEATPDPTLAGQATAEATSVDS